MKGVKLYTAEWYQGSRGWKLDDEIAKPFFAKCIELGIKNIHVHKGPTIWPLDKDAFDVSDVDHVATDYNGELNFIVEHVGLPRIEDFCFMATQEPNVYAGLSVVVGGLMHARPAFFAKVMGELLFWVGEDKMLFGSDYGIWEPKWQIEGLLDWEMPDDFAYATSRGWTRGQAQDPRAQRREAVRRRGPGGARARPGRRAGRARRARWASHDAAVPSPRSARDGLRPGARRTDHHPGSSAPCVVAGGRRGRPAAASDAAVRAELRVPDGRGRCPRVGGWTAWSRST